MAFRITLEVVARKIQGRDISEDQIDAWVAEAEVGYEVDDLRKRATGRPARGAGPSQVIPVRLTGDELAALTKRAEREHLNRSEAIRAALFEWSNSA